MKDARFTWFYKIGKYKFDGEEYYGVFEYFKDVPLPDENDEYSEETVDTWTAEPVMLAFSKSKEEILQDLQWALQDCDNQDVFDAGEVK